MVEATTSVTLYSCKHYAPWADTQGNFEGVKALVAVDAEAATRADEVCSHLANHTSKSTRLQKKALRPFPLLRRVMLDS